MKHFIKIYYTKRKFQPTMKLSIATEQTLFLPLNSIFGSTNNGLKPFRLMNFEVEIICPTMTGGRQIEYLHFLKMFSLSIIL